MKFKLLLKIFRTQIDIAQILGTPTMRKKYVVRALHSTFQPDINQPTHINQPTLMLEICHTRPSTNHFRPNS